jgi:transglutaminase-like putative cysteine protease
MERSASHVCEAGKSDCGGLSVLFVAALRANQVPARVLVGRWAQSSRPGEQLEGEGYYQTHVIAEFWADRVGWVPVDMALGLRKQPEGQEFKHFGNDPGNFIALHIDPELLLDRGRETVRIPWLQGVAYWVTGRGTTEGPRYQESWEVTEKPAGKPGKGG